jgi:hypothetical protein
MEYKVHDTVINDIPTLSTDEFINYILNNSTSVGGDEFLYFTENIHSMYEHGILEWAGVSKLPRLLLMWSDFIETEEDSIYKAWYIDTDKVVAEQPLILYTKEKYLYKICGINHSNYNLKLAMWRLNRIYNKKVKSIEVRCVDNSSLIKKVTTWDGEIPAVHKMKRYDKAK